MSGNDPMLALRRVLEVSRFDKSVGDGALSEMLNEAVESLFRSDERERIVERARSDARNIMEAARNAAKYEAWETAATLRIKATALRDHAFLVEEDGDE